MLTSSVDEITPKAIPSAPSTICAAKPIAMNGSKAFRSNAPKSGIASPDAPKAAGKFPAGRAKPGQVQISRNESLAPLLAFQAGSAYFAAWRSWGLPDDVGAGRLS
jgi:hypothetical protein